jgi:NTP pyrophosphatase (non-canonical NTP hydrolase)
MLVEECGELLNAIAKSKRDRAGKDEIITELADVSIIVEQMVFFYGEDDFKKEKERKLLRLKKRLEKHL